MTPDRNVVLTATQRHLPIEGDLRDVTDFSKRNDATRSETIADIRSRGSDQRRRTGPDRAWKSNLSSSHYAGWQTDPDQMTNSQQKRGGAPVGYITELDGVEAASVIYLRLWCNGPDSRTSVWNDFVFHLGAERGRKALQSFEDLCRLCCQHGRRPLMRHSVNCNCLGSDESCFASFIRTASTGDREDALLIATLLVRADVAPMITSLATEFGLALKRMNLCAPRHMADTPQSTPTHPTTIH